MYYGQLENRECMDCLPGQKWWPLHRGVLFLENVVICFQVCRFESPHCKKNLCICLAKKKHTFYFL